MNPWFFLSLPFLVASAWVCWRLSDWQWQRARSQTGSAQNYFYSIQWLVFAAMGFYGWGRAVQDVVQPEKARPRVERRIAVAGRIYVEPVIDDSADPELAAYNAMLERLATKADR
jgi:DNA-binding transcriptional regulator of glucitol operon